MANHGCINGTLDGADYSSPVPVIGLYIAGASLLCMLLMLYDVIVAGFLARKRWLPCKWFTLNSLTLTLLSVAAKLAVDLTTPMPSVSDQLSKLTATCLICISIGFFLPSLGVNSASECFTNMVALSIFVITVAVNVCIQLYTGVIVLFFVEHIIILGMMLLLLLMLWRSSSHVNSHKRFTSDSSRNLFLRGRSTMFDRLKLCYIYAYCSNPQIEISMHPMNAAVSTICVLCSFILMQSAFRGLILKQLHFCQGISDYGWSMALIVATQIATVLVGTISIVFRWLSVFPRMELEPLFVSLWEADDHLIIRNKTLRKDSWTALPRLWIVFASLNNKIISIAQFLIISPSALVRYFLRVYNRDNLEYFNELQHDGVIVLGRYIVRKSADDMVKFRDQVCKGESLDHLLQFLSENRPSDFPSYRYRGELISLSIALLLRIAEVSMPTNRITSMFRAYDEASEIIHFIDEALHLKPSAREDTYSGNEEHLSYAKDLWKSGDLTCALPADIIGMQPGPDRLLASIIRLKETLHYGKISGYLSLIQELIDPSSQLSIENLYRRMEQSFVDMLHLSLSQLPLAIYKRLSESPAEEFEESVRLAMKFLLKIGSSELNWILPPESGIPSFVVDTEAHGHSSGGLLATFAVLEKVVPHVFDPKGLLKKESGGRQSCCNF